jgi:ABC-type branched-subunit amino acid transport system permease subunit
MFVPTRVSSNAAWRAAISAGVVSGLLGLLPLGVLLAPAIGGFLCVLFYRRRILTDDPLPSSGFRLGLLSGVCGFVLFAVLQGGVVLFSHGENEFRSQLVEAVQRQQAQVPDAQARQLLDYFLTPPGMRVMIAGVVAFAAVVFVILSGVGGALAAMLLQRKQPPE